MYVIIKIKNIIEEFNFCKNYAKVEKKDKIIGENKISGFWKRKKKVKSNNLLKMTKGIYDL